MNHPKLLLGILFPLVSLLASASHIYSGFIHYQYQGNRSYLVRVNLVTTDISSPPDSDTIMLDMGDGNTQALLRIGAPSLGNNIKLNIYSGTYTYAADGDYLISFTDPNRINGITNINNGQATENIPIHLEALIRLREANGACHTSTNNFLGSLPFNAIVADSFSQSLIHNPSYPDTDSTSYELVVPLQAANSPVPAYNYPNQINPTVPFPTLGLVSNGLLQWFSPQQAGIYAAGIKINEYHNGSLYGYTQGEIAIIVHPSRASSPKLEGIALSQPLPLIFIKSVNPGDTVEFEAIYSDMDADSVSIVLLGEPTSVATNMVSADSDIDTAIAYFQWIVDSTHARPFPYILTIKGTSYYAGEAFDHDASVSILVSGPYNDTCPALQAYTGIQALAAISMRVHCYPNPATDLVWFETSLASTAWGTATFELYSLAGQQIKAQPIIQKGKWVLHRDQIPAGMYFYQILQQGSVLGRGKLIWQ
ncbi:MAG: T9SS type A sorting domain-containing protein [Chitinophagales bacterium]|nr:T9SS type A sorting domain-containing protein [Chitinophagales bacterium]